VGESLPFGDGAQQKRRSTRVMRAVGITVTGVDALGQAFREATATVMVNCHGCKYKSKYYVPKNSPLTVEIPRSGFGLPPRILPGRVIWVQRPRTFQEIVHIGVEFETPGNVWGIESPPEDWFPFPDEQAAEIPAASKAGVAAVTMTSSAESGIEVMPSTAQVDEPRVAVSWHMAEITAETAVTEEPAPAHQRLDGQIHEVIQEAVKASIERLADAAVERIVQQVADRTAAIVEEVRKAYETTTEQLDAKIRQAVEEAGSAQAGKPRKKKQEGSKRKGPERC
jgi:hypothetical protein